MEWDFEFVVSGLTAEQADVLLIAIIEKAEELGAVMGGGFMPHEEEAGDEDSK